MDDRYLYVLVSKTALTIGDIRRPYGGVAGEFN